MIMSNFPSPSQLDVEDLILAFTVAFRLLAGRLARTGRRKRLMTFLSWHSCWVSWYASLANNDPMLPICTDCDSAVRRRGRSIVPQRHIANRTLPLELPAVVGLFIMPLPPPGAGPASWALLRQSLGLAIAPLWRSFPIAATDGLVIIFT